ncbi:MAG: PBSX family phage terminase large subunit [Oscillospiraceae bacterium]|nr:PBSX family phage terminase large subunit [Oscillospiraceae bacterium]
MIFQKLSKKQKQVFKWCYQPDSYALICDGSVRSGKTAAMSCSFVHWAMKCFHKQNFAFCGNTVQATERNILMTIQQMTDITYYYKLKYIGSKHILTISGGGHENYFYIFGGKDESSYKLVQGITLAGVLFDEVALQPESFVNQAIARTLSIGNAKLWFNCNPDSPEHWFYKQWIQKADNNKSNILHIHFDMQDNPMMTPEKIDRTKMLYSGVFYDRYIKGLWVLAEGIVYAEFSKEKHVIENYIPENSDEYYISIDYGTKNPTSMGLWCLKQNGHAIRIRESYYDSRKKGHSRTDEEHYAELEWLAGDLADKIRYIVVDPSAASFIECIYRHRKFRVYKADNSVLDGIRDTATLLHLGYLQFDKSCKDIIREFGLYRWDDKTQGDKVIKENDHAMDDMRYFVRTVMWRTLKQIRRGEKI